MNGERFLAATQVDRLVTTLLQADYRVFGPATTGGRTDYRAIRAPGQLDLDAPMPALPLKALFLPPTEVLFTWKRQHQEVILEPVAARWPPTVVIGARPCDAAGVEALDKVMGWDYRDEAWFARREATTIVAVACAAKGPDCFCDALGLGPASSKGADVLLVRRRDGFDAQAVTGKGGTLLERCAACFTEPAAAAPSRETEALAPGAPLDLAAIRDWLGSNFDHPLWAGLGLRCHGCGACASVCPTCHCFDIVDEPDGLLAGTRRRNWDTCQSSKFTVHASGHNPRADQNPRFRQRVLHKFSIYPQRFDELLCTGCGRCAAVCPAGQNLAEILGEVARAAGASGTESPR